MKHQRLIQFGLDKLDKKSKLSWEEIGSLFNMSGEYARQIVKKHRKDNGLLKGKYEGGRESILVFSDLHVPDHNEDMILDIIKSHKNISKIILVGDILDCKAVSAWMDEEMSILDHEMIEAHKLLTKMRELTKADIIMVKGNHEQRVNVHYAKNAKSLGTAVLETEVLYKLANGFEVKHHKQKKKVYKRTRYKAIPGVYYCEARSFMYGDLLVNHPSIFSKDYMKTVTRIWNEKLRDKYPESKVVIIGHTHQLGQVHGENGVVLIECGCTCFPASYADQDDRPYRKQKYGYVYLEMKDKKVDTKTIDVVYLGEDTIGEDTYNVEDDY